MEHNRLYRVDTDQFKKRFEELKSLFNLKKHKNVDWIFAEIQYQKRLCPILKVCRLIHMRISLACLLLIVLVSPPTFAWSAFVLSSLSKEIQDIPTEQRTGSIANSSKDWACFYKIKDHSDFRPLKRTVTMRCSNLTGKLTDLSTQASCILENRKETEGSLKVESGCLDLAQSNGKNERICVFCH